MKNTIAHFSLDQVAQTLKTDFTHGLTAKEVYARQQVHGMNRLPTVEADSYTQIFFSQFKSPLIYLLLIAATVIFVVESGRDAAFIACILLLNALVGTYQEGKASNILLSLKKLLSTDTVVLRDGVETVVASEQLVPGDCIVLRQGDFIPVDARCIGVEDARVDESVITGESHAVIKRASPVTDNAPRAGYEKNMIFAGSYLVRGTIFAVVVRTGSKTFIGSMEHVAQSIDTDMPLKHEIERISYVILWYVLGIIGMLFLIGYLHALPLAALLSILAALFICVIPEGLPVVFTLVLAMGVRYMARKHVLVKRLQAIEALGRIAVLAVDKTGTLTMNQMRVQAYECFQASERILYALAAVIQNVHRIGSEPEMYRGDQTEVALYLFAEQQNFSKACLLKDEMLFFEAPFDYNHKVRLSLVRATGILAELFPTAAYVVYMTGAPEAVFSWCQKQKVDENMQKVDSFLAAGYRVVTAAYKIITPDVAQQYHMVYTQRGIDALLFLLSDDRSFHAAGCFALADLLRQDAAEMVARVQAQGIHLVMVTGDHLQTALRIARQVGIYHDGDTHVTVTQHNAISDIDDQSFSAAKVFARVAPHDKQKIVERWHEKQMVIGMTGDGVNDVPSLARADVGIAMGKMGTEVAKNAADILLLDDSLGTIVDGIVEGRRIFVALKRVILYFFTTNMAEILIIFVALLFAMPLPLNAMQILWLNLVTDGILTLALSLEMSDVESHAVIREVAGKRIVDGWLIRVMFMLAATMAFGSAFLFFRYQQQGVATARTMTLLTMVFFQLWCAWSLRSYKISFYRVPVRYNFYLLAASVSVVLLQLALVYAPFVHTLFHTTYISFGMWIEVILVSLSIFLIDEIRKRYFT